MRVLKVAIWNSTVNGRIPANKDAHQWLNGWKKLGFGSHRTYKDGRANRGAGEYLHVPVLGVAGDGRFYRIRCRFWPTLLYKGQRVKSLRVEKHSRSWYWILEFMTADVPKERK
jgi:hypothetical protein